MQKFKVLNEAGLVTPDEQAHAVGDVIELDETAQTTVDQVAAGLLEAVVEDAPVPEIPVNDVPPPPEEQPPQPAPAGHFTLGIAWVEGTTPEEIEAAGPFIEEFTAEMAKQEADSIPLCVKALTVTRD